MFVLRAILLLAMLAGATRATGMDKEGEPPLGHPDFYPSADRPVGWRGDGCGAFPGATPVTTWNSKSGANIVWKSRMPSPSWGQPIVVGEKVFTTADPNLLLCVNIHTGASLWQAEVDHTALMPPGKAQKAKDELAFFDSLFPKYVDGRRALEKLRQLAKTKGFSDEAVVNAITKPKGYKEGDPKNVAATGPALTDPEIKAAFEALAQLRQEFAFTFADPKRGDNWSAIDSRSPAGKALSDRLDTLIQEYDIWAWPRQNWYNCCSMTFAAPCSDGTAVFVAFPNNQVACYDLQGKRLWLVWEKQPKTKDGLLATRFCASPLLVADRLIVNQNSMLRAYDKATGRKLWEVKSNHGLPCRPELEAISPKLVRLPFAGKDLEFIATGGSKLYRLSDGVLVCSTLPAPEGGTGPGGPDTMVWGDLYLPKSPAFRAYRMKAAAPDKVEWTQAWALQEKCQIGESAPIVYRGVYYAGNGSMAVEVATGKKLPFASIGGNHNPWNGAILAGAWIIGVGGGMLGSASQGGVKSSNVLDENMAALDPEWERRPYCGQHGGVYSRGVHGHSSWYAAANRLFFRTAGHLWCIGDPKQPFAVPKNCPAEARAPR